MIGLVGAAALTVLLSAADGAPLAPAAPAAGGAEVPRAPRPGGLLGVAGVGYFERLHLGVALQSSAGSFVGAFAGTDFAVGRRRTWTVGLDGGRPLRLPLTAVEVGLGGKVLYWSQETPDYGWRMMTLGAGPYVARELGPGLSAVLDGGVALSFALGTHRKQFTHYEYPTRWNGSVCLSLRYGFHPW